MDKEMMEMFQTILIGMQDMEARINTKIEGEVRNVKIMIENDVSKRIESLFDGYQLVHEKQWALEKKMQELEKRLERLEVQHSA